MANSLKLAFLTTNDPIYLPSFFDRVLTVRGEDTQAVYIVPPLYRNQTTGKAALRYARTFGLGAAAHLAGRVIGAKVRGRSIASSCNRRGVRCETIADVNAVDFLEHLKGEAPDVLVSVSCPQIFKRPLIELAPHGILNIHGALLPQYRGVMPSFWMMANGEAQAGLSIYFVEDEKIDSGQLVGQRAFDIDLNETLDTFLRRSKAIAAELLLGVLDGLESGVLDRRPLDLAAGTYYSWPDAAAVQRFRNTGRRLW